MASASGRLTVAASGPNGHCLADPASRWDLFDPACARGWRRVGEPGPARPRRRPTGRLFSGSGSSNQAGTGVEVKTTW
jgi:hypothetical protein